VPQITPETLREHLERDLPGVLAPPAPTEPPPSDNGAEAPAEGKDAKKGKPKEPAGNPGYPAPTNDTLVQAARLIEVAEYMRDRLGYTFLSDIAVVDYLAAGVFELVYLFYHPDGGGDLKIKVQVPREQPDVPSLTPVWPGAGLNEREGFDLFGINFVGHPYPMRIYLWDEFEGHPMRRDFPKQGDKYLDED
jgi:NADH-quinone oxidoreductase subunit C